MELDELLELAFKALWAVVSVFDQSELVSFFNLSIPIIIIAVLAFVALRQGGSLKEFLLPKEVREAVSVKVDLRYYLLIIPLRTFILIPSVVVLYLALNEQIISGLQAAFGVSPVTGENSTLALGVYTVLMFLCLDFGFYISHYFQHKWRFLWAFHKVHHSPTQLIFLTSARFHPVDILWNVGVSLIITSFVSSAAQLTFYSGQEYYQLFGGHVFVALSYLTTHNFRHSHFWLHYPKWMRQLMSPAQHQIHHSSEPRHIDKNMGYLLTIWDRLFGTLYEPEEKEAFALGVHDVPETGPQAHDRIWKMLWLPCVEAWKIVRTRN